MKVAEFRDILEDLKRIYAAAGATAPANEMAALADAIKDADEQDYEAFLCALEEKLTNPAGAFLNALVSAGLEDEKFEAALKELERDKSIKAEDLDKIGAGYTKSPRFSKLHKTRAAKLKRIRQAFYEMKDFESRGKVIDGLMPWQ